jgi:hypothetical protein
MKRIVICVITVALVAFCAATSAAKTVRYHGPVAKGGSVSFKAVVRDGKIKRVKHFRWKHVPLKCQRDTFKNSGSFIDVARVRHREFLMEGNNFSGSQFGKTKGKFRRSGKVTGRLIINGAFGSRRHPYTRCHVKGGTIRRGVRWRAHRG